MGRIGRRRSHRRPARTQGADQWFEVFAPDGARDFRSIGHKAIYVSNGFRTLQCIGWRYSEPVLRSLASALLNHEGQPNPAEHDLGNDRPWRENLVLSQHIRPAWLHGRIDDGATRRLLESLRVDSPTLVCQQIVEILNAGVSPQSVYDALFAAAGEMLMRQPGIVSLHASTTTNAMPTRSTPQRMTPRAVCCSCKTPPFSRSSVKK